MVARAWGPARLLLAELRLLARPPRADAVIVGYPGHLDLLAARRAARGAPIVFNPLVSLADTLVEDRGRFRPGSLAERALRAIDRRALRSADIVVADTGAHAEFLADLAGLPPTGSRSASSGPRSECSGPAGSRKSRSPRSSSAS